MSPEAVEEEKEMSPEELAEAIALASVVVQRVARGGSGRSAATLRRTDKVYIYMYIFIYRICIYGVNPLGA